MRFKELTVSIEGPLWRIHDLEIESTNFIDKWDDVEPGNRKKIKKLYLFQ